MELKPCPFCGGKADYDNNESGLEWVYCTECGATGESFWMSIDVTDQAIKAWNNRQNNDTQDIDKP